MKATFSKYTLKFFRPGGTSRGVLTQKETFFICLQANGRWGIGEAGLFRGLSADDRPDYEARLESACRALEEGGEGIMETFREYPSIVFGLEQAMRSLKSSSPFELFPSRFLDGAPISINGLIWMGELPFMQRQLEEKIKDGFRCLKLKIGALDFESELRLLREIRGRFSPKDLEIRVDANGAFSAREALGKLRRLSEFELHSIEQPIRAGQPRELAELCARTPLPIALDEELIGCYYREEKERLLEQIRPQYIILKPSLVGGITGSREWIEAAESRRIGWWVTSALESNIGLNAIAQWTATLDVHMPQGLGTGSLFSNNFKSPLEVSGGKLWYRPEQKWDTSQIKEICI
jgi:o-succinylbenzoate synthase